MNPASGRSAILSAAFAVILAMAGAPAAFAVTPQIDCEGANKAYSQQGIPCYCQNGQIICSQSAGKIPAKNSAVSTKAMVAGALFESLLTSVFSDDSASQQQQATAQQMAAAQQKAAAIAAQQAAANWQIYNAQAQAAYDRMMQSYKTLGSPGGAAFKTLSDTALSYKTLGDGDEALAASAQKPFDTAGSTKAEPPGVPAGATPFFGDTMPLKDIRVLFDPASDARLVDLRKAEKFVVGNIKGDKAKVTAVTKKYAQDAGEPIIAKPDCVKLAKKLDGYLVQREKFQQTVTMAREQIDTWETANNNALMNAVKDGMDYFVDQLLDCAVQRGRAAERLEGIYQRRSQEMLQEGIDTAEIEAKIKKLKTVASVGHVTEVTRDVKDWQGFIKDGASALLGQLTASDREIKEMLDDPKLQKYFETESPALKALLDITKIAASHQVFGKWLARKMPAVAALELTVKQAYNGTEWFVSLQRLIEANTINGQVLSAAKDIQKHIDDAYFALRDCR